MIDKFKCWLLGHLWVTTDPETWDYEDIDSIYASCSRCGKIHFYNPWKGSFY